MAVPSGGAAVDWRYASCVDRGPASSRAAPVQGVGKTMIRFGFNIRTKTGQRVENISIMAGSQTDAERRLRQMYLQCEILECREQSVPRRIDTLDVERVIGLIAAGPPSLQKASAH
jgi:hypothetical protein